MVDWSDIYTVKIFNSNTLSNGLLYEGGSFLYTHTPILAVQKRFAPCVVFIIV